MRSSRFWRIAAVFDKVIADHDLECEIITFFDYKNVSVHELLEGAGSANIDLRYVQSADDKVKILTDNLLELHDRFVATKTICIMNEEKPWWNERLRLLCMHRDTAYTALKRNRSNQNFEFFRRLRNLCVMRIRDAD